MSLPYLLPLTVVKHILAFTPFACVTFVDATGEVVTKSIDDVASSTRSVTSAAVRARSESDTIWRVRSDDVSKTRNIRLQYDIWCSGRWVQWYDNSWEWQYASPHCASITPTEFIWGDLSGRCDFVRVNKDGHCTTTPLCVPCYGNYGSYDWLRLRMVFKLDAHSLIMKSTTSTDAETPFVKFDLDTSTQTPLRMSVAVEGLDPNTFYSRDMRLVAQVSRCTFLVTVDNREVFDCSAFKLPLFLMSVDVTTNTAQLTPTGLKCFRGTNVTAVSHVRYHVHTNYKSGRSEQRAEQRVYIVNPEEYTVSVYRVEPGFEMHSLGVLRVPDDYDRLFFDGDHIFMVDERNAVWRYVGDMSSTREEDLHTRRDWTREGHAASLRVLGVTVLDGDKGPLQWVYEEIMDQKERDFCRRSARSISTAVHRG